MTHTVIETTRWARYDEPPGEEVHNDHGAVEDYAVFADGWPSDAWRDAAAGLLAVVDEARCALADLVDEATGQMCSNGIGWTLHEYEEGGGRVEWATVVLVEQGDGSVVAVCEECGPSDLYWSAALAAKEDERARANAAARMAARRG